MTANQVVAYNLRKARKLRDLNQNQAAERLAPHLGERWSVPVFSAAERSVTGKRIREFTADQIYAFSVAFELPVSYFLLPPPHETVAGDPTGAVLERLFTVDGATNERLLDLAAHQTNDERTATQQNLRYRTERYVAAFLEGAQGDLERRERELRETADLMERARGRLAAEAPFLMGHPPQVAPAPSNEADQVPPDYDKADD